MPLPDSGTYPVSNKDVVSFTFDNPTYSVDRPVSNSNILLWSIVDRLNRFWSIQRILQSIWHTLQRESSSVNWSLDCVLPGWSEETQYVYIASTQFTIPSLFSPSSALGVCQLEQIHHTLSMSSIMPSKWPRYNSCLLSQRSYRICWMPWMWME